MNLIFIAQGSESNKPGSAFLSWQEHQLRVRKTKIIFWLKWIILGILKCSFSMQNCKLKQIPSQAGTEELVWIEA